MVDLAERSATATPVTDQPVQRRRPDLRPNAVLWRPLAIVLTARVATYCALYVTETLSQARSPFVVFGWDSIWYIRAAQHGWPHSIPRGPSTLAFFPALPAIIRAVHAVLPLDWRSSGNLAAFVTQVAMVIAVWLLTRDLWNQKVADRTVVLLCFFPGAYIFSLVYSEPLFIAAAAVCMLALRRQRWVLAGIAAAIATITRIDGIALVLCCGWECFFAIRQRRQWRSAWSVVLAPTGILAWFAYLWASTGSFTAWLTAERNWGNQASVFGFVHIVQRVQHIGGQDWNGIVTIACTAVTVGLLVVLAWTRPPAMFIIFSAVVVAMFFFSQPLGLHPRFVMAAFPLIMGLAYVLDGELYGAVVGLSAVLMAGLLVVTVSSMVLVP